MLIYLQSIEDEVSQTKFAKLYEDYVRLMTAVAFKILKNHEDTEDAVSEALFSIARNMAKVRQMPEDKVRAFVIIVARHAAFKIYNKNKEWSRQHMYDGIGLPCPADIENGVELAMSRLPTEYRDLFILKYDLGLKSSEMAEILNISAGMVRQNLMKAKSMLREELKKEDVTINE